MTTLPTDLEKARNEKAQKNYELESGHGCPRLDFKVGFDACYSYLISKGWMPPDHYTEITEVADCYKKKFNKLEAVVKVLVDGLKVGELLLMDTKQTIPVDQARKLMRQALRDAGIQ